MRSSFQLNYRLDGRVQAALPGCSQGRWAGSLCPGWSCSSGSTIQAGRSRSDKEIKFPVIPFLKKRKFCQEGNRVEENQVLGSVKVRIGWLLVCDKEVEHDVEGGQAEHCLQNDGLQAA